MKATFPYKTILITGGAGSFGTALTKYLLESCPDSKIKILSRDEHKHQVLREVTGNDNRLSYFIGSVTDLQRLRVALNGVDLVVHAAAIKHVPACEYNPLETAQINIMGTGNVILACLEKKVKQAILLSTDKAVSPINCYGSSKLMAEKLWVQANNYTSYGKGTRFACTRYGNVMNSKGGVIEVWKNKLIQAEPLPVTNAQMTRFWMTLDEAVQLVVDTACDNVRGGIIVPLLPAFSLVDLAETMIDTFPSFVTDGKDPNQPRWEERAVRAGEKMHEELMTVGESARALWKKTEGIKYFVPAEIQDWEHDFPVNGCWRTPPAPSLHVNIDGSSEEQSILSYNSRDWPWRLDKKALGEVLKKCK
jgi:UDP-N-acetylglucosamine 4,6-dehydratase/5-epimerase